MTGQDHTKVVTKDRNGNARLKFQSSKKRKRNLTADIYRSTSSSHKKLRTSGGNTASIATREHRVHHPQRSSSPSYLDLDDDVTTTFATELDVAMDRNASELFKRFYYEVWPLARSLPEIIHHRSKIIDLLLQYMLSPIDQPNEKSASSHCTTSSDDAPPTSGQVRHFFRPNLSTVDLLHLLSVLARDLRHEIHDHLHSQILPRLYYDLLNPPSTAMDSDHAPHILDVSLIELVFRTISYLFKYDMGALIHDSSSDAVGSKQSCSLEPLRRYYGITLGHPNDTIRRLAAESFAPVIRQVPSSQRRHLRRVLRALSASVIQSDEKELSQSQEYAVDGIAHLLFEVARGAAGRLHSKSGPIVMVIVIDATIEMNDSFVVKKVVDAFFHLLCHHLQPQYCVTIVDSVVHAMLQKCNTAPDAAFVQLLHTLKFVLAHRNGILLREETATVLPSLQDLFTAKLNVQSFERANPICRDALLNALFTTLQLLPEGSTPFTQQMLDLLRSILTMPINTEETTDIVAYRVIQNYIPHVPAERSMRTMGTNILRTAIHLLAEKPDVAMILVHGLATVPIVPNDSRATNEQGDVFFLDRARFCSLSNAEKEAILKFCCRDGDMVPLSTDNDLVAVIMAGKVASFVAAVGLGDDIDDEAFWCNFQTVSDWHLQLIQRLADHDDLVLEQSVGMAISMLVESLSSLSSLACLGGDRSSTVQSVLTAVRPTVVRHLLSKPHRLWTLKSSVSFVLALQHVNMLLVDGMSDDVFDALIPCLRNRNHFLRFYALQILATFPKRPYVVDHADLDLTDDLDEEQDALPMNTSSGQQANIGLTGPCNVIDILLSVESSPVDINTERSILSNISRIGVLGRTGKLPVIYAEAAVSHLLGLFFTKYAPIWPVAAKALVDLAHGHESCVWSSLHDQISASIESYDIDRPTSENFDEKSLDTREIPARIDPVSFYSLCSVWETSNGENASLFAHDVQNSSILGLVCRHLSTDESSVFASLWNVVHGAPKLILAHSRTIVPIFLKFMQYQYYAVHTDDPDARELRLPLLLNEIDRDEAIDKERDTLNGRLVQQRLLCMMKAFSSVNGPHQLFKHKVLLSIFLSLVGSQDSQLSQIALSCVLRFKLPYLTPYADILKKFYEKGKSRDAMMELNSNGDSGKIDPDHRHGLIPVVSRLIFGRLSSRSGGAKSAKDSPAARRIATISFLSSFCVADEELYPFLYLMTRVYIPVSFRVSPLEMQDISTRKMAFESICSSDSMDCYYRVPIQVHQGFLNVLGVVVSQLGQRIAPFVPSFLTIVISLCKVFEVKDDSSHDQTGAFPEDDVATHSLSVKSGTIRSLCYIRLADIFENFSETIDLHCCSRSLWKSLEVSLRLLPVMVLNSEKVPSLLRFLQTISAKKTLLDILYDNQEIVPSVLRCLSDGSKFAVVEATLSFIENLLDEDKGRYLLQQHLDLMLDQFLSRLRSAEPMQSRGSYLAVKGSSTSFTSWRRELSILCRVSELVDETSKSSVDSGNCKAMESLCLLLVPFLDLSTGVPDSDKQRVLDILEVMVSKLPATCATSLYYSLGSFLGLFKSKVGMPSLVLRKSTAAVLCKIANTSYLVASRATKTLLELCAVNAKRVNEMDFDVVIRAIGTLGANQGDSSWSDLCFQGVEHEPSVLLPLVNSCFCFLLNDDGVVSRSSFKALTSLIALASEKSEGTDSKWRKLLESAVVPSIKSGLNSHSEFVRRMFILLLREVVQSNEGCSSPSLFTDLNCLIHKDEPDLDFFLNITHVQLHRRARALQRLRKLLVTQNEDPSHTPLSLQSLSNVLLPLATHPIYECKTQLEESFTLEGIATVGAISRHLSWSKYNALLWNHLNQFERHPELEKYLIGLVCSIIDGFHFQIDSQKSSNDSTDSTPDNGNSIWKALEKRIIPKVEGMLVKEKDQKKGSMLRPSILLALHKLIHKLPAEIFQSKLPRLLAVVCDALRNRESDARDVARVTLAKMVTDMDMAYLADVLRELATSLTEGFKLHVRSATVHTILVEIAKEYKPPDKYDKKVHPPFDETVPAFMDLIQEDIFGEAQERKDAQGSQVRFVKEASGSKSAHSLELIATMILFRPFSVDEKKFRLSSIHALVTPFLERLRTPGVSSVVYRRIKECLTRIVSGLLRNPSVEGLQLVQFVYATLEPFVNKHEMESIMEIMDDDASSDDENVMNPIQVSGKRKTANSVDASGYGQVVEWRPSTLKTASSSKDARLMKEMEEKEKFKVLDGASAPKLTGSSRKAIVHGSLPTSLNDTATINAVIFCLQLLNPTLKNNTDDCIPESTLDRFVPLLTTCVCRCRTTDVVLLSLRCLGCLLRTKLPSLTRCSKSLATKTLELLTTAGSNQEQLQATFKMLTLLISVDQKHAPVGLKTINVNNVFASEALPLNDDQIRALLSYLRESIVSSDQHNSAIALTKAIMSHQYISVELYDLMETLLEQSVRSLKSTVRDQCGVLFVHYLINYPLSAEKIEQHLKQVVLNITYEYAEGRLSAIGLLSMIVDKLPEPVLEQHCQLLFLPLTLQLVNDDSKDCRELVAKCISKMLRNVSVEVAHSLYGYMERWSKGDVALRRMSLRLFAILVDVRPDIVKRNDTVTVLLATSQACLEDFIEDWEMVYFALLLLETMTKNFNHLIVNSVPLWEGVIHSMSHEHAWVKMAGVRLITNHILSLDPNCEIIPSKSFLASPDSHLLCFSMARNFCHQFGVDEEQQNDEMTAMTVKGLTWILQAVTQFPLLCSSSNKDDPSAVKEEDDDEDVPRRRDPVHWIIARLSHLARSKGPRRRQAIFKCFAAFATYVPSNIWSPHLEKMIEPLYRTEIEARNDAGGNSAFRLLKSSANPTEVSEEAQVARDVLQLLETRCASHELFLQAYQQVQQKARERKEARKAQQQTLVVTDPVVAAQKRIQKQTYEKQRRQRRVQEQRAQRGGTKKRRHV